MKKKTRCLSRKVGSVLDVFQGNHAEVQERVEQDDPHHVPGNGEMGEGRDLVPEEIDSGQEGDLAEELQFLLHESLWWGGDALSVKGDCEGNRQRLQTPPEG